MQTIDEKELAGQLFRAHMSGQPVEHRPTALDKEFNLAAAYRVVGELAGLARQQGWQPAGRKIGFTNRAVWEKLDLDNLVWGYVFDKTVHHFDNSQATISLKNTVAPRIEPEIVFGLRHPLAPMNTGADEVLESVQWMALGFEIVDCPYPNWRYRAADMVAAWGFHFALAVGHQHTLGDYQQIANELAHFRLKLIKNGQVVAEGQGSNVLDSPALSLGQLGRTLHDQSELGVPPLAAGEIITTGTVTDAQLVAPGEEWTVELSGLELDPLTIKFTE